jgi:hypothetical protein
MLICRNKLLPLQKKTNVVFHRWPQSYCRRLLIKEIKNNPMTLIIIAATMLLSFLTYVIGTETANIVMRRRENKVKEAAEFLNVILAFDHDLKK